MKTFWKTPWSSCWGSHADATRLVDKCRLPWAMALAAMIWGLGGASVSAQDVVSLDRGTLGTSLGLRRLTSTASVLHVVAHPDDEDGPLLAYVARGQGARTMLFSITRGEGGANLISAHFFDQLGALRTLEHLKAASYYGNELFYSRAADYGYSKTLPEAMRQWQNGSPILSDLVEVIRREMPLVIVSRFRGDPRDGHGHHQMAGVLAQLAFDAAADPHQFPEQLERGLPLWQPQKLFVGEFRRRSVPSPENPHGADQDPDLLAVPVGSYDPVLGQTYAQLSRFGLGFQRSQGITGHDGDPGPRDSYYRLVKSHVTADDVPDERPTTSASVGNVPPHLFAGIDTSVIGLLNQLAVDERSAELSSQLQSLQGAIERAVQAFGTADPEACVAELCVGLASVRSCLGQLPALSARSATQSVLHRQLIQKEAEFHRTLQAALGLQWEAWATLDDEQNSSFHHAIPGQPMRIHFRMANRSRRVLHIAKVELATAEFWKANGDSMLVGADLEAGQLWQSDFELRVPTSATASRPYWSRSSIREPLYAIADPLKSAQQPLPPPAIRARISVELHGKMGVDVGDSISKTGFVLDTDVENRFRHPQLGDVAYALQVVPEMSVRFVNERGVLPVGNTYYDVDVSVRGANKERRSGVLQLALPDRWTSEPAEYPVTFTREDEEASFRFRVHLPAGEATREFSLGAQVTTAQQVYRDGYETITARDLQRVNLYRSAKHVVTVTDVRVLGQPSVGYVVGSGDEVPRCLAMLGVSPQLLTTEDLATSDLSRWDLILVGVRAYAVRPDLLQFNARLIEYVKRGGVLIVQYQTPEFDHNFGPYPYEQGSSPEEVSEEDARVTMLQPEHPIFCQPNQITAEDFDGWVEQRGSKFWTRWDPAYVPLLECHDDGQPPQAGGMLIAPHGEGFYVYSAYSWYRQLPQGVPGAYRIFANLLSLPRTLSDSP